MIWVGLGMTGVPGLSLRHGNETVETHQNRRQKQALHPTPLRGSSGESGSAPTVNATWSSHQSSLPSHHMLHTCHHNPELR